MKAFVCIFMYVYMCVRSGPPRSVTCSCTFGFPGNRRKLENLSFCSCVSATRGLCVFVCFFASIIKDLMHIIWFWGRWRVAINRMFEETRRVFTSIFKISNLCRVWLLFFSILASPRPQLTSKENSSVHSTPSTLTLLAPCSSFFP